MAKRRKENGRKNYLPDTSQQIGISFKVLRNIKIRYRAALTKFRKDSLSQTLFSTKNYKIEKMFASVLYY